MDAVQGNARSCHLTEAVNIKAVDMEDIFNLSAHLLRPGLRTVDARLQLHAVHKPCLLDGLGQVEGVGRGAGEGCGSEILHAHHLSLGIPRRHGNGHSSQLHSAIVEPHTSREKPVPVTDVDAVLACKAGHSEGPGHALTPHLHVILCVGGQCQLACRAGCSLYPGDLLLGHCQQTERIVVS